MPEITVGNTVKTTETEPEQRRDAKIIQVDCFMPRSANGRTERRRAAERERREKEVELIRLSLQAIILFAMFIMISLLDAANLPQTVILMALIVGCAALMILLSDNKKEH